MVDDGFRTSRASWYIIHIGKFPRALMIFMLLPLILNFDRDIGRYPAAGGSNIAYVFSETSGDGIQSSVNCSSIRWRVDNGLWSGWRTPCAAPGCAGGRQRCNCLNSYISLPLLVFLFHRVLLRIIYSSTLLATYSLCGGQGEIDMHSSSVLMLK